MTSLVLLTGLPAAGKSSVAEIMAEKYGFAILSTDDLRRLLFREDYGETRKNGKAKEETVRRFLDFSKIPVLSQRFNLVIDASSPTDKFRRRMLNLPEDLEREIDKYLLYVRSDDSVLYTRQEARGRTNEAIEVIRGYWHKPQNGIAGTTLYEIDNNGDLTQLHERIEGFYKNLKNQNENTNRH